jgi:polysaccharide chain length determinant protein (PEP-CTERM system associated)
MLPGKKYPPEDVLRIIWRRKWVIAVPFVLISLCTFVFVRRLPKMYQSETLMLVVPQRVPETYVRPTVTTRIEDRLLSISAQIMSRTRLERIVHDLNLYEEERKTDVMEDVIARMRGSIHIAVERGDAFRISYVSKDPRIAQAVTERLASLFIEENLRDREVQAEGTSQFLDTQLDEARARLLAQERKLEDYRKLYAGQLPNQIQSNLQAIQSAEMKVQALTESINRDRDRRLVLERQIADLKVDTIAAAAPAATTADPGPGVPTIQRLEALHAQLKALESRYTAEHPDVISTKRLIRSLEETLAAESAQPPDGSGTPLRLTLPEDRLRENKLAELQAEIRNLDSEIERKQGEERDQRQAIASYQSKVDALPTRESELTELMRDYTTFQNTYATLLSKREDAKLAENLERNQIGEQFKMLDPARLPERPYSPDTRMMYMMGALGGLIVGLGLAALLEYRDSTFSTEDDVIRVLQLPVLTLVPMMASERERRAGRRRQLLTATAATLSLAGSVAAVLYWHFYLMP